ncbi:hypothetical protein [Chryseobacterium sp. T20]|uniref:hypothetical protein n=1 Tax=Chryseobacterium sp. T20 TaxID=3395375 RepID=UPI0039BCC927
MTNSELLANIILHENAYFFIKEDARFLSKKLIKETLSNAAKEKKGNPLINIEKQQKTLDGNTKLFYSVIVFKYLKKPSFIDKPVDNWEETKLAYICIFDFESHVVVARRNISKINDFLDLFEPLDYEMMTSIFSDENTSFEKVSMDNMNISDRAIRQKSLESTNLQENVSSFGLQNYTLNNVRLRNEEQKVALSLNSSRINQLGPKNDFEGFLNWAGFVIEKIKDYTPKVSFLSSFAKAVDYSKFQESLIPTSVLIVLSKLYKDYEENKIQRAYIKIKQKKGKEDLIIEFDLLNILKKFEYLLEVENLADGYRVKTNVINDLFLVLYPKSIRLRSKKLSKVYIEYENDLCFPILSVLNWSKSYIITFNKPELIYCNRKLFKDNRLLGNIDSLLKIFIPFSELNDVVSEKGTFMDTSSNFDSNSILGFVENKFQSQYTYFICDDLYKEWADHIGLNEDSIAFFHSKYKDSNFSASDFQDIIGQALKNLGNLSPSIDQWGVKETFWNMKYVNNKVETQIQRIRTGQTSSDAIAYFKTIQTYPNINKRVYIVINFISKSELEDRLQKLKRGEDFKEKNEVIQILWFVSSLISSCYEVNTDIYICCKP